MVSRLTLELDTPVCDNINGVFGPIYAVLEVDGVPLPRPKKADRSQYLKPEACMSAWALLRARYEASRAAY
jgi:hypothetical protein